MIYTIKIENHFFIVKMSDEVDMAHLDILMTSTYVANNDNTCNYGRWLGGEGDTGHAGTCN